MNKDKYYHEMNKFNDKICHKIPEKVCHKIPEKICHNMLLYTDTYCRYMCMCTINI